MTTNQASEPPVFSMSMCYNRARMMEARLPVDEYRERGKEVKRRLFRDVFPPEALAAWREEDARITAELRRLSAEIQGETLAHVAPPEDPDLIKALDLDVFAETAPKFRALRNHVDQRLGRLPGGGFEGHKAVVVRCCTCGPNCWKIDCGFSIRRKGSKDPFTISVDVSTKKGEVRTLPVDIYVSVAFTCSDVDYEKIFSNAALATA